MATSVGAISFKITLDRSDFDRALKQIQRDVQLTKVALNPKVDFTHLAVLTDALETTRNHTKTIQQEWNTNPLSPKIDDEALTQLNKHLDKKREHVRAIQQEWNANPLTISTKGISELNGLIKKLQSLSSNSIEVKTSLTQLNNNSEGNSSQSQSEKAVDLSPVINSVNNCLTELTKNNIYGSNLIVKALSELRSDLRSTVNHQTSILVASIQRDTTLTTKATRTSANQIAPPKSIIGQTLGGLSKLASPITNLALDIVKAPITLSTSAISKSVEGIFLGLGNQFTKKILTNIAQSDGGSDAIKNLDKQVNRLIDASSNRLSELSSVLLGFNPKDKPINKATDFVVTGIETILDPAKFKDALKNTTHTFLDLFTKVEAGMMTTDEAVQEGVLKFQGKFKTQVNNLLYRLLQIGAMPLAAKNQVELYRAARGIEQSQNRVIDGEKRPKYQSYYKDRVDPETGKVNNDSGLPFGSVKENIVKAENVVLTIGGFQRGGGKESDQLAQQLRPLADDKTTFIPIKNTFTDMKGGNGDKDSEWIPIISQLIPDEALGTEGKSMIHNVEKLVKAATKGVNPDAVNAAGVAHIVKTLFPEKNVSIAGFSGGGYVAEQAIALTEALGHKDIKGVGLGSPLMGLTNQASEKNYSALVGTLDPLTFPYATEVVGEPPDAIKKELGKTIPPALIGQGFVTPPNNVKTFPEYKGGHDVLQYVSTPGVRKHLAENIPGFQQLQSFDKSKYDPSLIQEYPDVVQALETGSKTLGINPMYSNSQDVNKMAKAGLGINALTGGLETDTKSHYQKIKKLDNFLEKPDSEYLKDGLATESLGKFAGTFSSINDGLQHTQSFNAASGSFGLYTKEMYDKSALFDPTQRTVIKELQEKQNKIKAELAKKTQQLSQEESKEIDNFRKANTVGQSKSASSRLVDINKERAKINNEIQSLEKEYQKTLAKYSNIASLSQEKYKLIQLEKEISDNISTEVLKQGGSVRDVPTAKKTDPYLKEVSQRVKSVSGKLDNAIQSLPKDEQQKYKAEPLIFAQRFKEFWEKTGSGSKIRETEQMVEKKLVEASKRFLKLGNFSDTEIAEIEKRGINELTSIAKFVAKRFADDPKLFKAIEEYKIESGQQQGKPKTKVNWGYYTPTEPKRVKYDFVEFNKYLSRDIVEKMPDGQGKQDADKYVAYLRALQKSLADWIDNKTPIPEDLLKNAEKILMTGSKLDSSLIPNRVLPKKGEKTQSFNQLPDLKPGQLPSISQVLGTVKGSEKIGSSSATPITNTEKLKEYKEAIVRLGALAREYHKEGISADGLNIDTATIDKQGNVFSSLQKTSLPRLSSNSASRTKQVNQDIENLIKQSQQALSKNQIPIQETELRGLINAGYKNESVSSSNNLVLTSPIQISKESKKALARQRITSLDTIPNVPPEIAPYLQAYEGVRKRVDPLLSQSLQVYQQGSFDRKTNAPFLSTSNPQKPEALRKVIDTQITPLVAPILDASNTSIPNALKLEVEQYVQMLETIYTKLSEASRTGQNQLERLNGTEPFTVTLAGKNVRLNERQIELQKKRESVFLDATGKALDETITPKIKPLTSPKLSNQPVAELVSDVEKKVKLQQQYEGTSKAKAKSVVLSSSNDSPELVTKVIDEKLGIQPKLELEKQVQPIKAPAKTQTQVFNEQIFLSTQLLKENSMAIKEATASLKQLVIEISTIKAQPISVEQTQNKPHEQVTTKSETIANQSAIVSVEKKENNLVVALQKVSQTISTGYSILEKIENIALSIIPYGKQGKAIGQTLGLPAAVGLGIGAAFPEAGHLATSIAHLGINPLAQAAGGAIQSGATGLAGDVFGQLPFIGNQLVHAASGTINATIPALTNVASQGASMAAGSLGLGATVLNSPQIVAALAQLFNKSKSNNQPLLATTQQPKQLPLETIDVDAKTIRSLPSQNRLSLPSSGEIIPSQQIWEEQFKEAKKISSGIFKTVAISKQRKVDPETVNAYSQTIIPAIDEQIKVINSLLEKVPSSQKMGPQGAELISLKGNLVKAKESVLGLSNKSDRFVVTDLKQQLQGTLSELGKSFTERKRQLTSEAKTAPDIAQSTAIKLVNEIKAAREFLTQLDRISQGLAELNLSKSEARPFESIVKQIGNTRKTVRNQITESEKTLSKINPQAAQGVGTDLAQGIETGITKQINNLDSIANQFIKAFIASAKKAGRIASPSKETEENIGKPLGEGVIVGFEEALENGEPAIDSAMNNLISGREQLLDRQPIKGIAEGFEGLLGGAQAGTKQALSQSLPGIDIRGVTKFFDTIRERYPAITKFITGLKDIGISMVGLELGKFILQPFIFSLQNAAFSIVDFVKASYSMAESLERIKIKLEYVEGSTAKAKNTFKELTNQSKEIGTDITTSSSKYTSFKQAALQTPLEDKSLDVIKRFNVAFTSQQLDPQAQDRALTAITQMVSKGKVQSEELVQQLAEAFPGGLQIAARGAGVSVPQLLQQSEAGALSPSTLIPKFARQAELEGRGNLEKAIESPIGKISKFKAETVDLQAKMGEGLLNVVGTLAGELGKLVAFVNTNSDAFKLFGIYLVGSFANALLMSAKNLGLVSVAFGFFNAQIKSQALLEMNSRLLDLAVTSRTGFGVLVGTIGAGVIPALVGLKNILISIATEVMPKLLLTFAAFKAIELGARNIWGGTEEFKQGLESSEKLLKDSNKNKLSQTTETFKPTITGVKSGYSLQSQDADDVALAREQYDEIEKKEREKDNKLLDWVTGAGLVKNVRSSYKKYIEIPTQIKEGRNDIERIDKTIANVQNFNASDELQQYNDPNELRKFKQQLNPVRDQIIQLNRDQIYAYNTGRPDDAVKLNKQISNAQQQEENILASMPGQSQIQSAIENAKKQIQAIQDSNLSGGAKELRIQPLIKELESLQIKQKNITDLVKDSTTEYMKFGEAIRLSDKRMTDLDATAQRRTILTQIDSVNSRLSGNTGTQGSQLKASKSSKQILDNQINETKAERDLLKQQLNELGRQTVNNGSMSIVESLQSPTAFGKNIPIGISSGNISAQSIQSEIERNKTQKGQPIYTPAEIQYLELAKKVIEREQTLLEKKKASIDEQLNIVQQSLIIIEQAKLRLASIAEATKSLQISQSEITKTSSTIALNKQSASGGIGDLPMQQQVQQIGLENTTSKLAAVNTQISSLENSFNGISGDVQKLFKDLLNIPASTSIKDFASKITPDYVDKRLENLPQNQLGKIELNPQFQALKELVKQYSNVSQQSRQFALEQSDILKQVNDAQYNQQETFTQASRSVIRLLEAFKSLGLSLYKQLADAQAKLNQAKNNLDATQFKVDAQSFVTPGSNGIFKEISNVINQYLSQIGQVDAEGNRIATDRIGLQEQTLQFTQQIRAIEEQRYDTTRQLFKQFLGTAAAQETNAQMQVKHWESITQSISSIKGQSNRIADTFKSVADSLSKSANNLINKSTGKNVESKLTSSIESIKSNPSPIASMQQIDTTKLKPEEERTTSFDDITKIAIQIDSELPKKGKLNNPPLTTPIPIPPTLPEIKKQPKYLTEADNEYWYKMLPDNRMGAAKPPLTPEQVGDRILIEDTEFPKSIGQTPPIPLANQNRLPSNNQLISSPQKASDLPNVDINKYSNQSKQIVYTNAQRLNIEEQTNEYNKQYASLQAIDTLANIRLNTEQKIKEAQRQVDNTDSNKFGLLQLDEKAKGYITLTEQIKESVQQIKQQYKQQSDAIEDQITQLKRERDVSQELLSLQQQRADIERNKGNAQFADELELTMDVGKKRNKQIDELIGTKDKPIGLLQKRKQRIDESLFTAVDTTGTKEKRNLELQRDSQLVTYKRNYLDALGTQPGTDTITANNLKRQSLTLQQNISFRSESNELDDFIVKQELSSAKARELRDNLKEINNIKLTDIQKQTDLVYNSINQPLENFFNSLGSFNTSFKQAMSNLFKEVGNSLLKPLSKTFSDSISSWVSGVSIPQKDDKKSSLLNQILDTNTPISSALSKDAFSGVVSGFSESVLGFSGAVPNFSNAVNNFGATIPQLSNVLLSLLQSGSSGGGSLIGTVGNSLGGLFSGESAGSSIGGFIGDIAGSFFKDGGKVSPIQFLKDGGIVEPIKIAKNGLKVGNFDSQHILGLGIGVAQAMIKEGTGATPIVAHAGENILTDRNGDAQLFDHLVQTGQWQELKLNKSEPINTFEMGGQVGGKSTPINSGSPSRLSNKNQPTFVTNTQTTNITVVTPDADSFRKSQSQIKQEEDLNQRRANRFRS